MTAARSLRPGGPSPNLEVLRTGGPARRGLTLIEILIILAIASVLFGLVISSYRGFQARQELTQAAKTLATNLRFAQSQAYGGVKNCGSAPLTGWYVTFQTNAYSINARCGVTTGSPRSILLPQGITMTTMNIPMGNSLLFRPINQDVGLIDTSGMVSNLASDVVITLMREPSAVTVTVRKTGDIL